MRDFGAFNTALLAKQFWRLATEPNSFAATVLKGKYFPRLDIWEAIVPPKCELHVAVHSHCKGTCEGGIKVGGGQW